MGEPAGDLSLFGKAVLDAFPSPVFIVDRDVRIVEHNAAAGKLMDTAEIRPRGGDALHCLYATESPGGCGAGEACRTCVVRNSVGNAFAGSGARRRTQRMRLIRGGRTVEAYVLVTTAPITYAGADYVLLVLEDITELITLRGILPICAGCRKIRDDQNYWHSVETYLKRQLDIDFSHGLCPECSRRMYPDLV